MKKIIDYLELRKLFDEKFIQTRQLILNGETQLNNLAEGFKEADDVIFSLPTVDAVEVVRCKNCKHYESCKELYEDGNIIFEDDGFCQNGEKREVNTT